MLKVILDLQVLVVLRVRLVEEDHRVLKELPVRLVQQEM